MSPHAKNILNDDDDFDDDDDDDDDDGCGRRARGCATTVDARATRGRRARGGRA
jgi:hypothetical protein